MKIKFNHWAYFGLIFILCLSLTACYNGHAEYIDTEYNSNADYKIISENGKNYIVFNNPSKYAVSSVLNAQVEVTISFNTLKEFRDTVAKGNLTDGQKAQIAAVFPKDEKGNVLTCDFDKLYAPTLPKDVSMGNVVWGGATYAFRLNSANGIFGYLKYLTSSSYKGLFNREYETLFDRDLIHVTETRNLGNGKTETYYYTDAGEFKSVRFSMSVGTKTIIVDKNYCLSRNYDSTSLGLAEPSADYPSQVRLYCDEGDKFWSTSLFGFTEDPTDEWLMQFGLTPYVEN